MLVLCWQVLLQDAAECGVGGAEDARQLYELLKLSAGLSACHKVPVPEALRRQLVGELIEREDALSHEAVAGTAQAAAGAFRGSLFRESEVGPLCAMLARRAEVLLDQYGAPAADDDVERVEHVATLAAGFGELRVYNSRLLDVVQDTLAPTVQAVATAPQQQWGEASRLVSETSLQKLCFAVGRLGPPLPQLHASLAVLSRATVPHADQIETLAKVSWWSAVLQGLDAAVGISSSASDEPPLQAALSHRLLLLAQRQASQKKSAFRKRAWDQSVSNVLWGLACHENTQADFQHTFWATVPDIPDRSVATSCRLHQCLMALGAAGRQENLTGREAKLAGRSHNAFLKSARRTQLQSKAASKSSASLGDDTLQGRVGQLLRRAVGDSAELEYEAVLPSGYTVDMMVRGSGRPIAVEVDGPSHFLNSSQVPRGETLMKRRHLREYELLDLVVVPYWEWAVLETEPIAARVAYLQARLAEAQC